MGQTKQRHNLQKIKLQAETTASARYAARVCRLEDARDAAMLCNPLRDFAGEGIRAS